MERAVAVTACASAFALDARPLLSVASVEQAPIAAVTVALLCEGVRVALEQTGYLNSGRRRVHLIEKSEGLEHTEVVALFAVRLLFLAGGRGTKSPGLVVNGRNGSIHIIAFNLLFNGNFIRN